MPAETDPEQNLENQKSALVTRAFSLMETDLEAIRQVREEEGLRSDSAALRRLIRDGKSFRDIRRGEWPRGKSL